MPLHIAIIVLSVVTLLIPLIFFLVLRYCSTPKLLSICTRYTFTELTKLSKYIRRKAEETDKHEIKVSEPITLKDVKIHPNTTNIPVTSSFITKNNEKCVINITSPKHSLHDKHKPKLNDANYNNQQLQTFQQEPTASSHNITLAPNEIVTYDIPRNLRVQDLPSHEQQMLEMKQLIAKLKTEQEEGDNMNKQAPEERFI